MENNIILYLLYFDDLGMKSGCTQKWLTDAQGWKVLSVKRKDYHCIKWEELRNQKWNKVQLSEVMHLETSNSTPTVSFGSLVRNY